MILHTHQHKDDLVIFVPSTENMFLICKKNDKA